MNNQELIPLLKCCTVRIAVPNGGFGTGFFIAPGWIATCAHVVEGGSRTVDVFWKDIRNNEVKEKALTAEVKLVFGESSDIAFLKLTTDDKHPCVYLDSNNPQIDDSLYIFGYPEDFSDGDSISVKYEGESISKDYGVLLKLKDGQIERGFSGSPLLNRRTGGVIGLVTTSRDLGSDMGGHAVPISMIYPSPKLANLSITDRKQLLEIIEGNRQSNKYNKRWLKISNWNKNISRTAFVIALTALLGLICLFLMPPEDLIILSFARLIIASALGYVVFLILKGKDIDISQLRGVPIKSLATFSTVVIALLASFILIPDKPVFLRNLTGTSEYPVLSLVNEEFPQSLSQVLGLKKTPIIDMKNPVYESIQTFREESGNNNLISAKYKERNGMSISYSLNNRGSTKTETLYGRHSNKSVNIGQTQEDFERDTVSYEGERQEFSYSSVRSPMLLSSDDMLWTAPLKFLKDNAASLSDASSNYAFLQYPRLSSISYLPDFKNDWIKHIAEANPNNRGFLGFIHRYAKYAPINKGDLVGLLRGCGIGLITPLSPTPYVRFLDIRNNSLSSLRIESIKKQIIQKNKYELSAIRDRDLLFQNIPTQNDEMNISISPGQDIFIPIEFGFDTRGMKKQYATLLSDANPREVIEEVTSKESFFGQPYTIPFNKLTEKTRDEIARIILSPTKLQTSSLEGAKSRKLLESEISNRFSVGSLINIKSIRISGQDVLTDNPLNDPRFSMSIIFAYGSCPYLMVYDAEKGYWKQLGTVITDRNDISLKGSEVHLLGDSSTKFRIEERDNEITYLDSLSLLYEDSSNETHEALLNIPQLDKLDKSYYVLHQGEFLNIDVKRFLPAHAKNIRLKVDGYYQILDPSKMITN
jgi:hypothetical protein